MVSVVLLLGSNDAEASTKVDNAIAILDRAVGKVVKCSQEHYSEAYGFHAERGFVNRAVEVMVADDITAYEVLRRINLIEALLGRDRDEELKIKQQTGEQYASRPIDIDIIFYGDATFSDSRLVIPYHFLEEREYALRPVAEIAAERRHPALRYTPEQMLERIER